VTASAAVGVLALLGLSTGASAQGAPQVLRVAAVATGSISGIVQDEQGVVVAGAVVSALGPTTAVAVTDRGGRFELRTLSPGPYVLRAHLTGFVASRGQVIEVHSSARASSAIALHHVARASSSPHPILAAGLDLDSTRSESKDSAEPAGAANNPPVDDDHGEVAWRLRHARRSILKDTTLADAVLRDPPPTASGFGKSGFLGSTGDLSPRLASTLFSSTPFSGQVNLLTAGSFDTPQQLFSTNSFARGIAFFSLGAPAGGHADWAVRGALTQGDISSWIVAATYATRAPARHQYEAGISYATERYDGGNLAALRDVVDGSRNVGALYGFDTFRVVPAVSVTYGARFSRYDFLAQPALFSPRLLATVLAGDGFRIHAAVSRRALAPGAEEFVPPVNSAIWLPPQRTFSSLGGRDLQAEHADHVEMGVERDVEGATVSIRAFRQHVTDQLTTLFGVDMPDAPAHLGHYFVANTGEVDAAGWSAELRTSLATRVHGSIEYTLSRAHSNSADNLGYLMLLAPSVIRSESERVHDVSTKVEAELPETLTRVMVVYRVSNAFAVAGDRPAFDSRFDVQVRQSLPFMDFGSAKWEMLLAVRNLFREAAADSSIYDELLVVHPPKRIVGGVTLRF
jgi:hypothetical protein